MHHLIAALSLLLALVATPKALAATHEAQLILLLDDPKLVAWLRDRDAEVAAAAERVAGADAETAQARLLPNPSLEATVGNVNIGVANPPGLPLADQAVYSFQLEQPLDVGKRGPRADAAELQVQSARAQLASVLATRVAAARAAMAELLRASIRQQVLEQTIAEARETLALQEVRLKHGDISGTELDRLRLDLLSQEAAAERNRGELKSAHASCDAALFARCTLGAATAETLDLAAPLPSTLPEADRAVAERADVRALSLSRRSAEKEAVLARRGVIPDPTLILGYVHSRFTISGDQADTIFFGLGIPLPVFDRGRHQAAKATAKARELEADLRATTRDGLAEIQGLLERRASLEANLERVEKEALPLSTGILETSRRAFERGEYSLTDLLLARRSHTDLQLEALDLRHDLFVVRNDLRRALGLDALTATQEVP